MAQKVMALIKLQIPAGQATPRLYDKAGLWHQP